MSKGKQGGNTSGMEYSRAKAKRRAAARASQERRWAAKSGPVTVTTVVDRSASVDNFELKQEGR